MSSRTSSNSNPSFPMNFLKFKQIVPNKQKKCKQNQNAKKNVRLELMLSNHHRRRTDDR